MLQAQNDTITDAIFIDKNNLDIRLYGNFSA